MASSYLQSAIDRLAQAGSWGYQSTSVNFSEPAALSAMALLAGGKSPTVPLEWLIRVQADNGAVGISRAEESPVWPTGLAAMAWTMAVQSGKYSGTFLTQMLDATRRATDALLDVQGETWDKNESSGHDPSLAGWPWVAGTHSWTEPTALAVLALKTSENWEHPRTRQGVELLVDRLLPEGGCNYGNTEVLGQRLRPHATPTGLAMLALAGEGGGTGRIAASLEYLEDCLSANLATISLCYAVLGLHAHGRKPPMIDELLATATERTLSSLPPAYKLALLVLASLGEASPLITLPQVLREAPL